MNKKGNSGMDWREGRRLRALELKKLGWRNVDIAVALGVTKGAITLWMRRAEQAGPDGLRSRPIQGRPSRLKPEQQAELFAQLQKPPLAAGLAAAAWTGRLVMQLVEQRYGVRYHPDHASRLLARARTEPNGKKPASPTARP